MRRLSILSLLLCAVTGSASAADGPEQKFVVFFQAWSAAIDDNADTVISHAADWVKSHPGNAAHINGFADPTGSKAANILMAELRAQVVVDQLVSDGLNPKLVQQRGHGSVTFASTSQESRRVEISIKRQ